MHSKTTCTGPHYSVLSAFITTSTRARAPSDCSLLSPLLAALPRCGAGLCCSVEVIWAPRGRTHSSFPHSSPIRKSSRMLSRGGAQITPEDQRCRVQSERAGKTISPVKKKNSGMGASITSSEGFLPFEKTVRNSETRCEQSASRELGRWREGKKRRRRGK